MPGTWQDYCALWDSRGDGSIPRIKYCDGEISLMSPMPRHVQSLPTWIEEKFFSVLTQAASIAEFEQWVYQTPELEGILLPQSYLDLISIDFSKQNSYHQATAQIKQLIDPGRYQTWKLKRYLKAFLNDESDPIVVAKQFYDLYCDGFEFLRVLGLSYVFQVVDYVPAPDWQTLTNEEKLQHLNFAQFKTEAEKVLRWLNEGQIVLTGDPDHPYIDNRTEQESSRIQQSESRSLIRRAISFLRGFQS